MLWWVEDGVWKMGREGEGCCAWGYGGEKRVEGLLGGRCLGWCNCYDVLWETCLGGRNKRDVATTTCDFEDAFSFTFLCNARYITRTE